MIFSYIIVFVIEARASSVVGRIDDPVRECTDERGSRRSDMLLPRA